MLWRMRQRIVLAAIWFWGFWSLGATLEFLSVLPSWPALAIGAAGVASVFRPFVASSPHGQRQPSPTTN